MWIKSNWKVASSRSSLLLRICLILSLALVFGMAAQICAGQTTIASKRNHDLYISLLSQSGKLVEKDEYCVLFSKTNGGEPAQVEGVFVDFERSQPLERAVVGQVAAYSRGVRWGGQPARSVRKMRPKSTDSERRASSWEPTHGNAMQSVGAGDVAKVAASIQVGNTLPRVLR